MTYAYFGSYANSLQFAFSSIVQALSSGLKGGGSTCPIICGCPPQIMGASIGNKVWNDTNANGIQDAGETGRAGVRVELYRASSDGVGAFVGAQRTDANGNYMFNNLRPGSYTLKFVAPGGTVLTSINAGGNDAADSDARPATGFTRVYTLAAGEKNTSVDAGLVERPCPTPRPDSATVCEDRATSFNVLANDLGNGLKLVKVAHESAALDQAFAANGGAISFTADGKVNYQSMTNYYGVDKLVYTVQDATGNQYTQVVNLWVNAVSDAPIAPAAVTYTWRHDGGAQFEGVVDGQPTWIHNYSVGEFGPYSDAKDALQDFGGYNALAKVASDADPLRVIRLYGLSDGKQFGTVLFDGKPVDFSNGKTFDVRLADIAAGRLDLMITAKDAVTLDWTFVDAGSIVNTTDCMGDVESPPTTTTIYTPIALDLSGDGRIGVTGATSSAQKDSGAELGRTVQFDADADGKLETIEWFDGSGDGILVDNRDGLAATQMNGARLFGTDAGVYANGYDKLAALDLDGNGQLDGEELAGLALWVDNGDAQVQAGELRTLGETGIASISTQLIVAIDAEDRGHLQSTATRADGSQVLTEDVYLAGTGELPAVHEVLGGSEASLDALVGAGAAATTQVAGGAMAGSIDVQDVSEAAEILRKISAAVSATALA